LAKGFAVLSDKRIYFKGTVFSRIGKRFFKTQEEKIVDVQDVTGTGFVKNSPIWALFLSICFFVAFFVWALIMTIQDAYPPSAFFALLAPAMGFLSMYFMGRQTLFEITFAGGAIAFNTVLLNKQEIQDFQRNIRLMKDAYEERQANTPQPVIVATPQPSPATPSSGNVADELGKYKGLFDSGVISEEEFNDIKSKLIGKL
jgi:hypothetical protein